jgi:hypothetical protein
MLCPLIFGLATDVLDHEGLTLMAAERVGALEPPQGRDTAVTSSAGSST